MCTVCVCVCVCERQTERQRETDRERERQRDRETDRQRESVTNKRKLMKQSHWFLHILPPLILFVFSVGSVENSFISITQPSP